MEPTTETNPLNRELTKTEIEIAIAQIKDRLMRLAKAQEELTDFCENSEHIAHVDYPAIFKQRAVHLREKYEIPEGVHLFEASMDGALTTGSVRDCHKHLEAWVKGKLTKKQCVEIYFFFEEIEEADWGWIMLERPLGYYGASFEGDSDSIYQEMISIGTRSRSKITTLTELIPNFLF